MRDDEMTQVLAENLKRARLASGFSQRSVSVLVGADQVQVSRWERGTSSPHVVTLAKLARLYRLPMDVFFVREHPLLSPAH